MQNLNLPLDQGQAGNKIVVIENVELWRRRFALFFRRYGAGDITYLRTPRDVLAMLAPESGALRNGKVTLIADAETAAKLLDLLQQRDREGFALIVASSLDERSRQIQSLMKKGGVFLLKKPFSESELMDVIDQVTRSHA